MKECCVEILASYPNYNDCPKELYRSILYDYNSHDKPMLDKEYLEPGYWKILWIENPIIGEERIIKEVDWYKCIIKYIRE